MSTPDAPRPTRTRGWTAAAALLALVVVALAAVLMNAAVSGPDTPTAGPTPVATTPMPAAGSATAPISAGDGGDRPAGCATTGTDQTVPTSTPSGVTWSLAHGIAVPNSSTDGPAVRTQAGVGWCYARTPVGAVLAASNLGQGTGSLDAINADGLAHSTTQNQYTDQLAAAAASPQSSTLPTGIQIAGFRVVSFSPTDATIALAFNVTGSRPGLSQIIVAMQWDRGDWRVVPQPGPTVVATKGPLTSLASFVPWSGVA